MPIANETPPTTVACIGAAHVDRMARADAVLVMGTSNPVVTRTAAGGVARNVAETLARLGSPVALFSRVGDDRDGAGLLAAAVERGIDVAHVERTPGSPTASYTAVLDGAGELVLGLADMAVYDGLDVPWADRVSAALAAHGLWFVDANLPAATIERLLASRPAGTVVLADPVSAAKAPRLAGSLDRLDVLFPDRAEAEALTGIAVTPAGPAQAGPAEAAAALRSRGVGKVVLSLGAVGVCLADEAGVTVVPPIPAAAVCDVTGAGDALVGGFIHGLLSGAGGAAVHYGLAAASLAVEAPSAVSPALSAAALAQRLEGRDLVP